MSSVLVQVGLLKRYSSPDPLAGLLELVRLENGLAADTPFQLVKSTTLDRYDDSVTHLDKLSAGWAV